MFARKIQQNKKLKVKNKDSAMYTLRDKEEIKWIDLAVQ